MYDLVEAITLLAETHWSSCGVEQAHGSMAVMHRFHPDYIRSVLCIRSLMHQMRYLFYAVDQEKRLLKLAGNIDQVAGDIVMQNQGICYFFFYLPLEVNIRCFFLFFSSLLFNLCLDCFSILDSCNEPQVSTCAIEIDGNKFGRKKSS